MAASRAVPWRRILRVAQLLLERFASDIPKKERHRLGALVRKAKGNPRGLTGDERREVVRILRHVDVARLGRDIAAELALARSGRLLRR